MVLNRCGSCWKRINGGYNFWFFEKQNGAYCVICTFIIRYEVPCHYIILLTHNNELKGNQLKIQYYSYVNFNQLFSYIPKSTTLYFHTIYFCILLNHSNYICQECPFDSLIKNIILLCCLCPFRTKYTVIVILWFQKQLKCLRGIQNKPNKHYTVLNTNYIYPNTT